jgi:CopG family nickel-responsive transcriptional regulator
MPRMDRFTISLPAGLASAFDVWLDKRRYISRSEAVRDLVRAALEAEASAEAPQQEGIGSLTYVYDHHDRTVAERIMDAQHDHHDLIVATTHTHLNHDNCLEICIVRGLIRQIEDFSHKVIGLKGVRHGRLHLVKLDAITTYGSHTAATVQPTSG